MLNYLDLEEANVGMDITMTHIKIAKSVLLNVKLVFIKQPTVQFVQKKQKKFLKDA